jgi:hypothetical protein
MEEEKYTRDYCKKIGREETFSLTCITNKNTHNFECNGNKGNKNFNTLFLSKE